VPPFLGFAGRWRLYLSGSQYGGPVLVVTMVLASGLTLLYYARAIHRVWLGAQDEQALTGPEPTMAIAVLMVLSVLILFLGVFPTWVTSHLF
jgi:NADH:ubiquinone oxidoreductase subunit 2 (subunit N)